MPRRRTGGANPPPLSAKGFDVSEQPSTSWNRGWIVTGAAVGINLILGVLYSWSVVAKALAGKLKWTQMEAAMPFAVSTAAFALMMVFAGRVQDKIGPKFVAMLGGLLLGLGLILSAFTNSPYIMALTFGVIGGCGIGLGYSATTPPCVKWFPPTRKGMITGLVVAGVGLSAVYMAPLTNYMLTHGVTIPQVFEYLGGGTIVCVCLLSLLLRNPPQGYTPPIVATTAAARKMASGRDLNWTGMLCTPQFYLLWTMFVLAAAPGLMILGNLATITATQVMVPAPIAASAPAATTPALVGWNAGFLLVMVMAAFNTAGRIVGGAVSDRIGRTQTMVLAFLLQAVNMCLFAQYTTQETLIAGTAFTGLCYGTIFTLMPAAMADYFGLKNLGVNYGFLFTAFGIAGSTGSLLGGRVKDLCGSYANAYYILAGMLAVAVVLAFITRPPRVPAEAPVLEKTAS
jgi:OFA family oxalate/formate antiporter-like MFS transporter